VVEQNSEEKLEEIRKDVKHILAELEKQRQITVFYFVYGLGMAVIAIGVAMLFGGIALSHPSYTNNGIILMSVGLGLILVSYVVSLKIHKRRLKICKM